MNALTAALKKELNVDMVTVFGLSIPESVVVSWGIMAFTVMGGIRLQAARGLQPSPQAHG